MHSCCLATFRYVNEKRDPDDNFYKCTPSTNPAFVDVANAMVGQRLNVVRCNSTGTTVQVCANTQVTVLRVVLLL